tara:strand:+ start:2082 stop:2753 length:672 start_codon:yes stop_codon:yes gene_type:complete
MDKNNITRNKMFSGKNASEVFGEVFVINDWSSTESRSGMGSTLEYTINTRKQLPLLWEAYDINKVVDIGCGDFNWMKEIVNTLDYYKGTDIVEAITQINNERYHKHNKIEFETCDIIEGCNFKAKEFDAIILKDVLVHFPTAVAIEVLNKIKNTGIKYAFITHFNEIEKNTDIGAFGEWRPLNMSLDTFNIGDPIEIIHEEGEKYNWLEQQMEDKTLSLWKIN